MNQQSVMSAVNYSGMVYSDSLMIW